MTTDPETAAIVESIMADPMSARRFDELISGPLNHPLPQIQAMRLITALKFITEAVPESAQALETFAQRCADHDNNKPLAPLYRVIRLEAQR